MSEKTSLLSAPGVTIQDDLPDPKRTLDTLATTLIVVLTVGVLYFAREILVPIVIAVLLSFVLSPLVKALRKLGLGKRLSVGIVVLSTFLIAVGLGAVLARQITDLAADAPKYQSTIMRKVTAVRTFAAENPVLSKLQSVIADVTEPQRDKPKPDAQPNASSPLASLGNPPGGPVRVEVVAPPPGVLTILQAAIGVAATPLATAAIVAIFIVFVLLQREDLRNRFIRLAGGDLQRTTLAMNDAARRLSRYFLVQTLINFGFGAIVAIVLTILGVPSAILWGIVAAFMRFIPYIGSIASAFLPVMMAAATETGWSLALETAVFFALLEFCVGQIIEPLVYGHHTGVSPIAVVISATFWTWLWGPVGLVLSTPMTVCLVVMGRHVSRLSFLTVLLGDAPVLTHVEIFYQRMLVGDPSEILDHADVFMAENSLLEYSDQVAMKALLMAQVDVRRGALDEKRQLRIRDTMRDLAEDLVERGEDAPSTPIPGDPASVSLTSTPDDKAAAKKDLAESVERARIGSLLSSADVSPQWGRPGAVICFAGRTPLDEAAAHLLTDLLRERGIGAHVEPADVLMRKDPVQFDAGGTQLAILSFLDADLSVAQARFAVRRLRRRLPQVPLMAAFWMAEQDEDRATTLCGNVRCDTCVSSLPQAVRFCLDRALLPTPIADAA